MKNIIEQKTPGRELTPWETREYYSSCLELVHQINKLILSIENHIQERWGLKLKDLKEISVGLQGEEVDLSLDSLDFNEEDLSNLTTDVVESSEDITYILLLMLNFLHRKKLELMVIQKLREDFVKGKRDIFADERTVLTQTRVLIGNEIIDKISFRAKSTESKNENKIDILRCILVKLLNFADNISRQTYLKRRISLSFLLSSYGKNSLQEAIQHRLPDDIEEFISFSSPENEELLIDFSTETPQNAIGESGEWLKKRKKNRLLASEWMRLAKQQAGVPWLITTIATLFVEKWELLSYVMFNLFTLKNNCRELPIKINDQATGMHIHFWIRRDSVIEDIISLGELLRDFSKANIVKHIIPASAPTSEAREEDGINSLGYNYAQQLRQHRLIRDLSQMFMRVNHSANHADHPNSITLKTDTGAKMQISFSKLDENVNLDEIHGRIFGCKKPVELADDYTIKRSRGTNRVSKHIFKPG